MEVLSSTLVPNANVSRQVDHHRITIPAWRDLKLASFAPGLNPGQKMQQEVVASDRIDL
jgi:hypothetical protein